MDKNYDTDVEERIYNYSVERMFMEGGKNTEDESEEEVAISNVVPLVRCETE